MSRTRRFIDNARWLSVINLSQSILALAVSIVLARTILPGAFGKFAYMLALAEGLSLLTGFGINTSILQNNRHPDREFRNTGFFLSIALILGYTVVALPVGLLLVPELIYPYLLVVAGKAVFMGSGVHGILLQKDFKFKYFSLIQFGAFLVSSSTAVVMALSGFEMRALVAQYVIVQVLTAGLTIALSPFSLAPTCFTHRDSMRTFFGNGRQLFASQMVEKLLATIDRIWITHALGAATLAFYNRAIGLTQRFQTIFLTMLQPLLNVSFADLQSDRERSGYFLNTAAWALLRASLMLTLIFVASPREFILILFGENWLVAAGYVPLLAPFVFLAPLRGLTRNFLLTNGRFVALRNTQILELALFAAALWIGSAARGIEGLCIGVSAWSVASLGLYLVRVSQVVRFELRRVLLLPAILLPAIIALNQFVRGQAAVAQLGPLALACLSSALVVSACAVALVAVESRDLRALIRRIRS